MKNVLIQILSKNDVSDWSIIFAVNFEDKKEQNDATIDDEKFVN